MEVGLPVSNKHLKRFSPPPPTEVCPPLEVGCRFSVRELRKSRIPEGTIKIWANCKGLAGGSGPQDQALAVFSTLGPQPVLWPSEPSWKEILRRLRLGPGGS